MLHRVEDYIRRNSLLADGQRVLVALSGGADSVCLLLVLRRLGYNVVAAHCNFHLRGEESERDQHFVEDLCRRLGVELHIAQFDTRAYAAANQLSIEMAARNLRYEWFARFSLPTAIAHHRDDNNETLLLNIVRGTGLRGLSGIRPEANVMGTHVVRPLLCVGRADILEFLAAEHQGYVTDSTNLECDARRNVIRLQLLPLLATLNPSIGETLQKDIEHFAEAEKLYDAALDHYAGQVLTAEGNISIDALDSTPSGLTVLYHLLSPKGFSSAIVSQIYAERHGQGGAVYHSYNYRLLRHRGCFVFGPAQGETTLLHDRLPSSGCVQVTPAIQIEAQQNPAPQPILRHHDIAMLDADKLTLPLAVRFIRPGDRFSPYGMKGSMLVSDYLTNCHATLFEREEQLVVTSGDNIVWLVGRRISRHAAVTDATARILTLRLEKTAY